MRNVRLVDAVNVEDVSDHLSNSLKKRLRDKLEFGSEKQRSRKHWDWNNGTPSSVARSRILSAIKSAPFATTLGGSSEEGS